MEIKTLLSESAKALGLVLDEQMLKRFSLYGDLLLEWNEKINLTAIKQPEEIAIKHFVDSLTLLSVYTLPQGARVIDVGTGAGFPGVPLKIVRPDLQLTLLDSLNKRLIFLQDLLEKLELQADCVHLRAEEGGLKPELRERFDLATSRAVANLNLLAEYCLPYVKVGGIFAAMKGPDTDEELSQAQNAIQLLGGRLQEKNQLVLPDGSGRTILLIKKVTATPQKYPRHGGKIAKKPL